MHKIYITIITLILTTGCSFAQHESSTNEHGFVDKSATTWQAWDSEHKEWTSLETFWERYAESKGGYTYGPTTTYPPYNQVKEFDTLLIEVAQGPCLMEFFHSRWRRANDVRRWDDAFNEYAGCPFVFE